MSNKLKLTGEMRTIPMHDKEYKTCPIGINHGVEWPIYLHVHENEGDCIIPVPHHILEDAWAAMATITGNLNPGDVITKEQFAEIDEAYSNLDAYKHGEHEPHTYAVVELAIKSKDIKGLPIIKDNKVKW